MKTSKNRTITLCLCDGEIVLRDLEKTKDSKKIKDFTLFFQECHSIRDLYSDYLDSFNEDITEIPLYAEGVTKNIMEHVLHYIRNGELQVEPVDIYKNVVMLDSIRFVADYLGYQDLIDHILLYLANQIKQNCTDVMNRYMQEPKVTRSLKEMYDSLDFYNIS